MSKIYTNGIVDVEIVQPDPLCVNGTVQYYVGPHSYPRRLVESLDSVVEYRLSFADFREIADPLA